MNWLRFDLHGIPRTSIEGVDKLAIAISRELEQIEGRCLKGYIKAAIVIRNETTQGDLKVPVDLGNLKNSWFVVTSSGFIQYGGGRSHTADGNSGKFSGPNAGKLAGDHSSVLTEMKGKAENLEREYQGPFLIMGYSANYALWVHENLTNKHKEGTGALWFEKALRKHRETIFRLVSENARIKG